VSIIAEELEVHRINTQAEESKEFVLNLFVSCHLVDIGPITDSHQVKNLL